MLTIQKDRTMHLEQKELKEQKEQKSKTMSPQTCYNHIMNPPNKHVINIHQWYDMYNQDLDEMLNILMYFNNLDGYLISININEMKKLILQTIFKMSNNRFKNYPL